MPERVTLSDGTEKEVFTQEEVDAKSAELRTAQEEAEKVKEELSKLQAKDLNFANLRSQKEDADKKVKALKDEVDGFGPKMEQLKKEVFEGVLKDHLDDQLTSLAGGDEEMKKKIQYHFKRLSDPATTKQEIDKKLRDAWSLAAERPAPQMGNAFASMGSAPMRPVAASSHKFSEEEKAFAKQFAAAGGIKLSDEDLK